MLSACLSSMSHSNHSYSLEQEQSDGNCTKICFIEGNYSKIHGPPLDMEELLMAGTDDQTQRRTYPLEHYNPGQSKTVYHVERLNPTMMLNLLLALYDLNYSRIVTHYRM